MNPLKKYQFNNAMPSLDKQSRKEIIWPEGSGRCSRTSRQTRVSNSTTPVLSISLQKEISLLNAALESSEQDILTKELQIEVLGERLNKALTSKVFELQKYRSEFFGKLQTILGEREDIKIVGDRFIFESEL